jgi:DNA-binding SARP family transcriptional activator
MYPKDSKLCLTTFGRIEVMYKDKVVISRDSVSRKLSGLLCFLVERRSWIPVEELIEVFWSDISYEKANSSFRNCLYRLRRTLEPHLKHGDQSSYILYRNGLCAFNSDADYWWDVEEFESLCNQVRNMDENNEHSTQVYTRILELYGGDYLAHIDEVWAMPGRQLYKSLYLEIVQRYVRLLFRKQQFDEAIAVIDGALDDNQTEEGLWSMLITAQLAAGKQREALQTYNEAKRVLKASLEIDFAIPVPELRQLGIGGRGWRTTSSLNGTTLRPHSVTVDSNIFELCYYAEAQCARICGEALSLLVVDIHPEVDCKSDDTVVLIESLLRKSDRVAYFGNGRYGVLLPYAGQKDHKTVSEKIDTTLRKSLKISSVLF